MKRKYIKDEEGKRRLLYNHLGFDGYWDVFTTACSGCHETLDGYELPYAKWDDKIRRYIGFGCSECGYTGKRRVKWFCPLDREGFEKMIHEEYKKENGDEDSEWEV